MGIGINNTSKNIQEWLSENGPLAQIIAWWNEFSTGDKKIITEIKYRNKSFTNNEGSVDLTPYLPEYDDEKDEMELYQLNTDYFIGDVSKSKTFEATSSITTPTLYVKNLYYNNNQVDLDKIIELSKATFFTKLKENTDLTNIYLDTENQAYSEFGAAFGENNYAGVKAFTVLRVNKDANTVTLRLDSIKDIDKALANGEKLEYSFNLRFVPKRQIEGTSEYEYLYDHAITRQRMNIGVITGTPNINEVKVSNFPTNEELNIPTTIEMEINGEKKDVPVIYDFYPYDEEKESPEDLQDWMDEEANTFRIISRPDLGSRNMGYAALVSGYWNRVHSKGGISAGYGNNSFGSYASTFGKGNNAGYIGTAIGLENNALGETAFVANRKNTVRSNNSTAFGSGNIIESGMQSLIGGSGNKSYGDNSVTFGTGNINRGIASFIIGLSNIIKANNSLTIGQSNEITSGTDIFASGSNLKVDGASQSGVFGLINEVRGSQTFTAGKNNTSYAPQGAVFGLRNTIGTYNPNTKRLGGNTAFAANLDNEATGAGSTTFGRHNIANKAYQFVRGLANDPNKATDCYDIVGGGEVDGDGNVVKRANIYTLNKYGIGWFAGGLKIGGTQQSEGKDVVLKTILYGDQLNDKEYLNYYNPINLIYYYALGYEKAPFEECVLMTFYGAYYDGAGSEITTHIQYAFSDNGQMKYRAIHDGALEDVEWELLSLSKFNNDLDVISSNDLTNTVADMYESQLSSIYDNISITPNEGWVDLVLYEHVEHRMLKDYENITRITLSLPEYHLPDAYWSYISFRTTDTPLELVYPDSLIRWSGDDVSYDGIFSPEPNKIYEVAIKLIGYEETWDTEIEDLVNTPVLSARVGIV